MIPSLSPRPAERHVLHLPVFEGPLDLLLYLIRKQELDISDIPIALITEQYTGYLKAMGELNLDVASEYILMVATLIHIKSRMLLPQLPMEEEGVVEDPRKELAERLVEYERYKTAAATLRRREDEHLHTHTRADNVLARYPYEGGVEATTWDLVTAFREILDRRDERAVATIEGEEYHVEDKARAILLMLAERGTLAFREIFKKAQTLIELLVYFLALLDLIREERVRVEQSQPFGEILVYSSDGAATHDTAS